MKKILFILLFSFIYSNADTALTLESYKHYKTTNNAKLHTFSSSVSYTPTYRSAGTGYYMTSKFSGIPVAYCKGTNTESYKWSETNQSAPYRHTATEVCYVPSSDTTVENCTSKIDSHGLPYGCIDNELEPIFSPDPTENYTCKDLYEKDGVAYTCNPNTNEATPIENSNGLTQDENGDDIPSCNEGFEYTSTPNITVGGNGNETGYTSWGCASSSGNSDTGNNSGNTSGSDYPTIPDTGVITSANGTKSWSIGGTTYELTTDGVLTTTYADGSQSVKQVGTNGGSSGGTGTSGGSGTNGNTTNEDNTSSNNDTPVDDTPAANSCTDGSLTLQEKMLCEMNAGMKKLNSESNTQNSLNNLLKDLNNTSNTNATAINTNLKSGNTTLTGIKSLNENQLNEQKKTNDKLKSVENGVDGTNLLLGAANTKLEQIRDNLQDEEGKSYLSKISDFIDTLTTPTSDEDKNSYGTQINTKVSSTLDGTFSKYSNVLGFGSSYGNRPENISIVLFNNEYTLIDFSLLDPYINLIRTLFLTLAYMYGFMNLIRSSR